MNPLNPRLAQLIDAHLLEELSPEMEAELLALLDSEESLREFVRDTHLHYQLRDLLVGCEVSIADELWMKDLPSPAEIRRASPEVATLPPQMKWTQPFAVVVAAALFYGAFVAIAWNLQPGPVDSPPWADRGTHTSENVALSAMRLVDESQDCEWEIAPNAPASGRGNSRGEIRLRRGLARFAFGSGAVVHAEGPARFEAVSAGYVRLIGGKLTAQVPAEAIGFTVETPTVTVVDLGTEFTVEAAANGETEVRVLAGKVQTTPAAFSEGVPGVETLVAGESRRFVPPTDSGPKRLAVGGAMASSEWLFDRGVNNLTNGSGLVDGRHSNEPANTMWHSAVGKVDSEFVLFDLVRSYCLHSIKVWNYNEAALGLFRVRGVKRADVYVSSSGRGNPISHPDDWRLIVDEREFHPADGTSAYATPDEVPLGNVEARFVALVIREGWGLDPRSAKPTEQCVGLSEVQFFGEVIAPEKAVKRNTP